MFGATTGAGGQSSFSFGASAANNNTSAPKASFSFGVPAATSNTASGTTGGAFGLGNTNNQTSQPATGMFGQPAAKPSVFGTQQNATPAAGDATGSTGLFGSAGQALNQTQTGTSGGLGMFGQAQNTNQAGQANNAFGATQAKPAFGFGNTSTTQAPNTGFGQTSTNAAPASNLFGSTTTQPTSNLFGSTAAKPTTNLFGGSTTAAAQPSTNLFGGSTAAQPANNLFGSSTAAQPSSNLFGSTAAQPAKPGLFGTSSTTQPAGQFSFGAAQQPQQNAFGLGQSTAPTNSFGLGQSTQQQQQQQQQPIQQSQYQQQQSQLAVSILGQSTFKREVPIVQRLEGIKAAWDPSHPDCKFKCVLYNSVEPQDVHRYGRPPNVSDELWEKANRENPDPSCMVPVIATGWEDVQKRLKGQVDMVQKEDHQIKELSKKLDIIERQKAIQTTIRLVGLQTKLSSLHERLVHLAVNTASTVQPSTSSSSSAPIRAKEQQLKSTLESVKAELDGSSAARSASSGSSSNGYGYGRSSVYGLNDRVIRPSTPKRSAAGQRMMGQVNELWGAVEELRRRRGYRGQESEGWLGDERVMNEIGQVLSEQQNALQKLMTVLSEAEFDQKVIDETLRNVGF